MIEVITLKGFHEAATNISYAMMHAPDADIRALWEASDVDSIWELACEIACEGPQNDMERRILAFAMQRRLEGV